LQLVPSLMEFHEQAASEAAVLVDRLQASCTEKSIRQLQLFRSALDAAMQSIESAVAEPPSVEHDEHVGEMIERLTEAAAAHTQSLLDHANASAKTTIESMKAALHDRASENEELIRSLDIARGELEKLRVDYTTEMERIRTIEADRKRIDELRVQAETAWVDAEGALQRQTEARATAEAELKETRSALETAKLEAAASMKELEKEAAERARLTASLAKVPPQPFDALLTTLQSFATATTIDEVLSTLVDALASDFSRVALFRVTGNQLEGVRQIGLDFDGDISTVSIPLTVGSHLTHSVTSGCVEGFLAGELPEGRRLPFSGTPNFVLTLPIVVRREPLAVIYADDADRVHSEAFSPDRSVKFAQILLWQAIPMLTRLSTDLVALTELRQYATMLVNEIEHIYNADAATGKKSEELQSRLRENLQCARQIYAQRVTPEGPFAATLLEEQLALQTQAGTAFGRDVAAVMGRAPAAVSSLEMPSMIG
jgi:hypothetical protein